MPFDSMPAGEPWRPWCRSCKQTIQTGQPSRQIAFDHTHDTMLRDLNGPYHDACARPFLSLAHALRILTTRF